MRKSILTIAILTSGLFVSSVLLTGCGTKKEQTTEEDQHMKTDATNQHDGMEMTYACSMHPEVTGKEGDTCSKCGMKLELVKSADTTENHSEHQH